MAPLSTGMASALNPARLRRTAAATSHAATIPAGTPLGRSPQDQPAASGSKKKESAKSKKAAAKLQAAVAKSNISPMHEATPLNLFIWTVLSLIIYGVIFGWVLGLPVFDRLINAPLRYVFGTVTYPVRMTIQIAKDIYVATTSAIADTGDRVSDVLDNVNEIIAGSATAAAAFASETLAAAGAGDDDLDWD